MEVVALKEVAAQAVQDGELLRGFHALGQHLQLEHLRHGDDGGGDLAVVGVVGQAAHEALVDLELVDRETLQVGQGGVAGTEVVDRQPQAQAFERLQQGDGLFCLVHEHALGQLQLQAVGRQAGVGQRLAHRVDQVAGVELARRQVHRHHPLRLPGVDPGAALPAGLAQHPLTQRHDQPGVFGDRDEAARRHQRFAGGLPAHQRFHPGHTPPGVDERLVVQQELAVDQGVAQPGFQLHAFAGCCAQRSGVEAQGVAPALFGQVHGHVGVLDQLGDAAGVRRVQADADAHADEDLLPPGELEGGRQGVDQRLRHGGGLAGRVDGFQHQQEFVAPQPGQRVLLAQPGRQTAGQQGQQLVAHRMAQAVVDVLEAVQVQVEHRHLLRMAFGPIDGVLQTRQHEQPIGQAGERVVVRQVLQPFLGLSQLADVGEHRHVGPWQPVEVRYCADGQPLRKDLAGLAAVPDLALPVSGCDQVVPHVLVKGLVVTAGLHQAGVAAQHLFGAVAGDVGEGSVDRQDARRQVGDHHAVAGGLEEGRGLLQRFGRAHLLHRQGSEAGELLHQFLIGFGRLTRFVPVDAEGAQHLAGLISKGQRPAGPQTGSAGQVTPVLPVGVGVDVADDHRLAPPGRGAAAALAFSGHQALHGRVVLLGQARRSAVDQAAPALVEQLDGHLLAGIDGLQPQGDVLQDDRQGLPGHQLIQHRIAGAAQRLVAVRFADVDPGAHRLDRLPLGIAAQVQFVADPQRAAVCVVEPVFVGQLPLLRQVPHALQDLIPVLRVQVVQPPSRLQRLGGGETQQPLDVVAHPVGAGRAAVEAQAVEDGRAGGDQVRQPPAGALQRRALPRQMCPLVGLLQRGRHLVEPALVFGEVIVHPQAQRGGGHLLAAVAGDQHDRQVQRALFAQQLGQLQPIHAGQAVVHQQHVEGGRLRGACGQLSQCLNRIGHADHADVRRMLGQVPAHQVDVEAVGVHLQHPQRTAAPLRALTHPLPNGQQAARQPFQVVVAFDQVVVRTGLEGGNRGLLVARAGQDHDGQRQLGVAHPGQHVQAAPVGQGQIGQHQVVNTGLVEPLQPFGDGGGHIDLDAHRRACQGSPGEVRIEGRVFDVEHPHRHGRTFGCRWVSAVVHW